MGNLNSINKTIHTPIHIGDSVHFLNLILGKKKFFYT